MKIFKRFVPLIIFVGILLLVGCGGEGSTNSENVPSAEVSDLDENRDVEFDDKSDSNIVSSESSQGMFAEESSGSESSSSEKSSSSESSSSSLSEKAVWKCLNPRIDYDEMIDERDGQVYKTVRIGEQLWMAENLNYVSENFEYSLSEKIITTEIDTLSGMKYNWDEAQSVCPDGWHLPSRLEYQALVDQAKTVEKGYAGLPLMSKSCSRLWDKNSAASDVFGFSAIPNYRTGRGNVNTVYYPQGSFWSSSDASDWGYLLSLDGDASASAASKKNFLNAVRCVKTEGNPIESAVESSSSQILIAPNSSESEEVDSLTLDSVE